MTDIDVTIYDLANHLCAIRTLEPQRHAIFVKALNSLRNLIESDTLLRVTRKQNDEARHKLAELKAAK